MRDDEVNANARLIAASPSLLDSCKELREAMAAAMRVMVEHPASVIAFAAELSQLGISNGFGVRAAAAIANAEGRTS